MLGRGAVERRDAADEAGASDGASLLISVFDERDIAFEHPTRLARLATAATLQDGRATEACTFTRHCLQTTCSLRMLATAYSSWRACGLPTGGHGRLAGVVERRVAADGASPRRPNSVTLRRGVLAIRRAPAPQLNAVFDERDIAFEHRTGLARLATAAPLRRCALRKLALARGIAFNPPARTGCSLRHTRLWRACGLRTSGHGRLAGVVERRVAADGASPRRPNSVTLRRGVLAIRRAPAPQLNAVFDERDIAFEHRTRLARLVTAAPLQEVRATEARFCTRRRLQSACSLRMLATAYSSWRACGLPTGGHGRLAGVVERRVAADGASPRRPNSVTLRRGVLAMRRAPAPQLNAVLSRPLRGEVIMPTRALLLLVVAGCLLGGGCAARDDASLAANRETVIAVMKSLRPHMTRAEVEAVLARTGATRFRRQTHADSFVLLAQAGPVRVWQLGIAFKGDGLSAARVWTEDGPYHPAEVPPDIGVW